MERKTPAAANGNRGLEMLAGGFHGPLTLATYRAQLIASRYAIPIQTAAIVAGLYFMEANHG